MFFENVFVINIIFLKYIFDVYCCKFDIDFFYVDKRFIFTKNIFINNFMFEKKTFNA